MIFMILLKRMKQRINNVIEKEVKKTSFFSDFVNDLYLRANGIE